MTDDVAQHAPAATPATTLNPTRLAIFAAFHAACFAAIWTGVSRTSLALCAAMYVFQVLSITIGYHRYFAHRSFTTSRPMQLLLAFFAQATLQKGALWWAAHHRYHHQHSDQDDDLHSPKHGLFWAYAGWIFHDPTRKTRIEEIGDFAKYPELVTLDRFVLLPALPIALLCYAIDGWSGVVVGFVWASVLSHHATFANNCFAHVFGTQPYETGDLSRNNWFLGLVVLGEGWHNNHHRCASSARLGFLWWEIDLAYYVLLVLARLGLIRDLRDPPPAVLEKRKASRAAVPVVPVRAKALFEEMIEGSGIRVNGTDPWDIQVLDDRFYARVLRQGTIGLGESYMDGWWDSPALDQLMDRAMRHGLKRRIAPKLALQLAMMRLRQVGVSPIKKSRRVAEVHYDLGNAFFRDMLGPTMAYSCGYWPRATNLEEAQHAKFDLISEKLGLEQRHRFLDIGCGWGGLLAHASRTRGCQGLGITISEPQHQYATQTHRDLPIRFLRADFRDHSFDAEGPFDRIASVGMFEHVPLASHREFFSRVHELLADDGLFLLHTIGNKARSGADPWIDRYIFPNSVVPCATDIAAQIDERFVLEDWHVFGDDYDRTFMAWARNFEAQRATADFPFDLRFQRMWWYWLNAFAGAFRSRNYLQLWQIVLSKKGVRGGYRSVR